MAEAKETTTLEHTPTWVVAGVCSVMVVMSLGAERGLHYLGKLLKHYDQKALFEALLKLKEELMLLGFISLLLTVFQSLIGRICITERLSSHMLPCKKVEGASIQHMIHYGRDFSLGHKHNRRLLSEHAEYGKCSQGKVPMLSTEALHQLHIFIFVLALVHVAFCAITMFLGGAKVRRWKHWEDPLRNENLNPEKPITKEILMKTDYHYEFLMSRAKGFWRKSVVVSWMMSFFKQFHASVTKSDYTALRSGFIMRHCSSNQNFDFHKFLMRTLELDFKKVVGISWYLWLFVVIFLLLDVDGWHTYFWLSFLPLVLLLVVGAKLEHVIIRLAQDAAAQLAANQGNSFEIAFFFWILTTFGFDSCIMEKVGYIVPRLCIGVIIQVLCSYSTLPLYAIVTQMGDSFKQTVFAEQMQLSLHGWAESAKKRKRSDAGLTPFFKGFVAKSETSDLLGSGNQIQTLASQQTIASNEIAASEIEISNLRPTA